MEWRSYSGRYRVKTEEPALVVHTDLFPPYLPLVKQGVTLDQIASQLLSDHATLGHSQSLWGFWFGNWLRASDYEATGVAQANEAETMRAQNKPHRPRLELAQAFKKDFDGPGFIGPVVAKALAEKVRH